MILYKKHIIERAGAVLLLIVHIILSFTWYPGLETQGFQGFIWVVVIFALLNNFYEQVQLHEGYIQRRKLHFFRPKTKTLPYKHIQDINQFTLLPGFGIITIKTGNESDMILRYFEKKNELIEKIIEKIGS